MLRNGRPQDGLRLWCQNTFPPERGERVNDSDVSNLQSQDVCTLSQVSAVTNTLLVSLNINLWFESSAGAKTRRIQIRYVCVQCSLLLFAQVICKALYITFTDPSLKAPV